MGLEREGDDCSEDGEPNRPVADGGGQVIQRWDPADPEGIPAVVVRAVGEATDTDPIEMNELLTSAVDPDALVALMESSDGNGDVVVHFTLSGESVTVRDDGLVTVGDD